MKPLEWLGLGIVAILGYFFWKSRTEQTTSPACPAQTQLDGWLSDIATGKMTTDDANKLAQSYANATPPCTDAVSAINAAIAAKGAIAKTPLGKAPIKGSVPGMPPSKIISITPPDLIPHKLTSGEAAEDVSAFRSGAGFMTDDDFLHANPSIAVMVGDGEWAPPVTFRYAWYNGETTHDYPLGRAATFTPTGRISGGSNQPTFTTSMTGLAGEWVFLPWTDYGHAADGSSYVGPEPTRVTSSGGQRMSLNRGVWAWDEGMTVNVKPGSPVTTAGVGVGYAAAPLLLAAEPWR